MYLFKQIFVYALKIIFFPRQYKELFFYWGGGIGGPKLNFALGPFLSSYATALI